MQQVDGGLPSRIQRSLALQACTRNAHALEQLGLFPPEMQGRTEESKEISEEEEDG